MFILTLQFVDDLVRHAQKPYLQHYKYLPTSLFGIWDVHPKLEYSQ